MSHAMSSPTVFVKTAHWPPGTVQAIDNKDKDLNIEFTNNNANRHKGAVLIICLILYPKPY